MKQLSQNLRSGKLTVDEVPRPVPAAGQVLVASAFSVISAGTERSRVETGRKSLLGKAIARPDQVRQVLHSLRQLGFSATMERVRTKLEARSPLGYSAAGTVLEVGSGVDEFRPGDRVACAGASASHGEVVTVPRNLCAAVPPGVELDNAAFTTLGAIALQGIRLADVRLGEVVVVIGLGLLGQLTVQLLRASGCRVAGLDPVAARCELARTLGAAEAAGSEAALRAGLARLANNHGADAVIITAGTPSSRPVELAGELCREKGRVVAVGAVGLTLPRAPYYDREISFAVSRSYGPGRYDPHYEEQGHDYPYGYVRWTEKRNMEAVLALMAAGQVDACPLITHRFAIGEATLAYDLIGGKSGEPYLGVLFAYNPQGPAALEQATTTPAFNTPPISKPQGLKNGVGIKGGAEPAPVRFGVIGAGNFAQAMLLPHLKNHPHVALISLATLSPLGSKDAAERFGFHRMAASPEEILTDPAVQAVIIATRHDSHAALAVQALQAGKAVHLEKPLALNEEELSQVIAAYAAAQHPFLTLGFNRRFAPLVQQARQFFAGRSEPLAMNFRINAGYIPLEHWSQDPVAGGGRIIGEACHFIDLLQYFAGAPVTHISAQAAPNLGKYRNDNAAISLAFADGSVGTVLYTASGDRSMSKEYIELFCEGNSAVIDDYTSLAVYSSGRKTVSRQGARDKGHRREMEALIAAVCRGEPEPVPFGEAVAVTRATFAAERSIASGARVELQSGNPEPG